MIINFKSVKLCNFMSFDNAVVKLDDRGFTLISGINNNKDDLAKSNGSGKSSLIESIVWCLTGETIRGVRQVSNKFTNDGALVELDFTIDNVVYKLIRTKDNEEYGTNLKIYVNGKDKSGKGIRDSEKILSELLPDLSSSLLGSVIVLGQGLPQRFTNNTPSGRKEVLEKLSKSDFMIEDIKTKLSNRKIHLNSELRKYEDSILSSESKKKVYEEQLVKYNDFLNNAPVRDYDNELVGLEMDKSLCNADISSEETKINNLNADLNRAREEYLNNTNECNKKLNEISLNYVDKISDLNNEINKYKLQIENTKKEITKLENIKDTCPTCGQKLPDVHKVDTTNLHNELTNFNDKFDELNKELIALEDEKNSVLSNEKVFYDENGLKIKEKGELIKSDISAHTIKLNEYKNNLNKIETEISSLKLERDKLSTILEDIKTTETNIETITQEILYNILDRDNIKSRLDLITKMTTIATRDFRGFLLSEIIKFINSKAKEYALDIFETDKIEFKLDGNNIDISYCDKQYESLSGGEKQKVDIIIQFSIRDMLSKFLNFSSNILVLDEIFDNLDNIGCQKVLDLISNKLVDVSSIFIITHHSDIEIPNDDEIVVIKDENGISRVL